MVSPFLNPLTIIRSSDGGDDYVDGDDNDGGYDVMMVMMIMRIMMTMST